MPSPGHLTAVTIDVNSPTHPSIGVHGQRFGFERLPAHIVVQALDTLRLVRDRAVLTSRGTDRATRVSSHRLRDTEGVARFVSEAWDATADALCNCPDNTADLVSLLSQLRALESAVAVYRRDRSAQLRDHADASLARLGRCTSITELVDAIPRQAGTLGFDRVLFSSAGGACWTPRAFFATGDRSWATPYLTDGRVHTFALPLAARRLRSAHVDGTVMQRSPDRASGFGMWQQSKSKDFWMFPIAHGDRLIGMMHADCHLQQRLPTHAEVVEMTRFCARLALLLAHRATLDSRPSLMSDARTPELLLDDFDRGPSIIGRVPVAHGHDSALSDRELEVVRLLAEGLTNAQIGRRLTITEGTVKSHVKRILKKTGSANRAEAVAQWLHTRPLTVA